MQADLYTKVVLTVIALALVWLGVQPFLLPPQAGAQSRMRVIVERVEWNAFPSTMIPARVRVEEIGGNISRPLPVKMEGK
ncbi:MAG: hypothetical protein HY660_17245 [Armatimonadetes bacterium]|nr:hypothetical protein [Armatimonadota bacterium]